RRPFAHEMQRAVAAYHPVRCSPKPPVSAIVNFRVCSPLAIPELQAIALTDGFRTLDRESQQCAHDLPRGMSSHLAPGGHHGRPQQHEPASTTQCSAQDGFFRSKQPLIEATDCVKCLTRAE